MDNMNTSLIKIKNGFTPSCKPALNGPPRQQGRLCTLCGFTLAEVLVTIAIIGTVAAIVIPNIVNATESQKFKFAYKKEFGVLDQAFRTIMINNGGAFPDAPGGASGIKNLFKSQLNVMKDCSQDNAIGNCTLSTYHCTKASSGVIVSEFSAGHFDYGDFSGNRPSLVLADGTTLIFGLTNPYNIVIDVNGNNPPNTIGRDVFGVGVSVRNTTSMALLTWEDMLKLPEKIIPGRGALNDGWDNSTEYLKQ